MKTLKYLFVVLVITAWSCGQGGSDKANKENEASETEEVTEEALELSDENKKSEFKNCDEFLDAYEEWIDGYLELLEKYMKNPMDPTISKEYLEKAQKLSVWATDWMKVYTCAADEKYKKRFKEISEKAEKKMEELNLN
jgi:hypothetical protein